MNPALTPLDGWIAEKVGCPGRLERRQLENDQLDRLRSTLRAAASKSRFYAERFKTLDPDSFTGLGDLSRLPFTRPEDLARAPYDFLCVSPREIERIVTLSTSGTTGNPKRVFFTPEDQELTVDFFHRGMRTLVSEDDTVMIFMPGETPGSVGDLLSKGLSRLGCRNIVYGPIRDFADAARTMVREGVTSLVGIPSQIVALARDFGSRSGPLKSVLLSADYVPKAASDIVYKAWGAALYGHYGMTEMGFGGGVECAARDGYHLREADLLFEIVDPVTLKPVPDGHYGEIVFTTLTRRGMPLIRYRTGDRSRFIPEPCPCQTRLKRLERVSGRIRETVFLRGGSSFTISELDEALLPLPSVSSYSAAVDSADGVDRLILTVSGSEFDRERLEAALKPVLGEILGSGSLTLALRRGDAGFFTTGTLKRKIYDLRDRK